MGKRIPYTRGKTTFMGTTFKQQTCNSCKTTYEQLALGADKKRNKVKCQFCDRPELFEENTNSG